MLGATAILCGHYFCGSNSGGVYIWTGCGKYLQNLEVRTGFQPLRIVMAGSYLAKLLGIDQRAWFPNQDTPI
jgi:hypothetical protein